MSMSNYVYPFRVDYPRTKQWYPNHATYGEGDWMKISNWCDECIGKGDWEFYNNEFVFATEQGYMLFKLKWL